MAATVTNTGRAPFAFDPDDVFTSKEDEAKKQGSKTGKSSGTSAADGDREIPHPQKIYTTKVFYI